MEKYNERASEIVKILLLSNLISSDDLISTIQNLLNGNTRIENGESKKSEEGNQREKVVPLGN